MQQKCGYEEIWNEYNVQTKKQNKKKQKQIKK